MFLLILGIIFIILVILVAIDFIVEAFFCVVGLLGMLLAIYIVIRFWNFGISLFSILGTVLWAGVKIVLLIVIVNYLPKIFGYKKTIHELLLDYLSHHK